MRVQLIVLCFISVSFGYTSTKDGAVYSNPDIWCPGGLKLASILGKLDGNQVVDVIHSAVCGENLHFVPGTAAAMAVGDLIGKIPKASNAWDLLTNFYCGSRSIIPINNLVESIKVVCPYGAYFMHDIAGQIRRDIESNGECSGTVEIGCNLPPVDCNQWNNAYETYKAHCGRYLTCETSQVSLYCHT